MNHMRMFSFPRAVDWKLAHFSTPSGPTRMNRLGFPDQAQAGVVVLATRAVLVIKGRDQTLGREGEDRIVRRDFEFEQPPA